MVIIAITGGRDTRPTRASLLAFVAWCERLGVTVVRHGDCPLRRRRTDRQWASVDRIVADFLHAETYIDADAWPPLWKVFPRWVAGPRRNGCMLSGDRSDWGREPEAQVVRLVAWPGGSGTADCREQATALRIPIIEADEIERWDARRLASMTA